ncbi:hypothetical protein FHW16_000225 [Phyllobacterium myrsinacearum]|uniref:Uncharacterized protein n=1 Tax=Phyllobacterium myrsinacearum TaxID=28101 RepID=A0A839E9M7_9HYPH|nr:hypothetical protein [Phyllobacterium myrsinacearum]
MPPLPLLFQSLHHLRELPELVEGQTTHAGFAAMHLPRFERAVEHLANHLNQLRMNRAA